MKLITRIHGSAKKNKMQYIKTKTSDRKNDRQINFLLSSNLLL